MWQRCAVHIGYALLPIDAVYDYRTSCALRWQKAMPPRSIMHAQGRSRHADNRCRMSLAYRICCLLRTSRSACQGALLHPPCGAELCRREAGSCHVRDGDVNMAGYVQFLIDSFAPDAPIVSGIAGSLNPELGVGDIVLGETLSCLECSRSVIAECAPYAESFHSDEALVDAATKALRKHGFAERPAVSALASESLSVLPSGPMRSMAPVAAQGPSFRATSSRPHPICCMITDARFSVTARRWKALQRHSSQPGQASPSSLSAASRTSAAKATASSTMQGHAWRKRRVWLPRPCSTRSASMPQETPPQAETCIDKARRDGTGEKCLSF